MRSFFENKRLVLLFSLLALGALTVLTVSLRDVSFNDAQPIGWSDSNSSQVSSQNLFEGLGSITILRSQIILWAAIALVTMLVGILLSPNYRKWLFRFFFRAAVTYWILVYIMNNYGDMITSMLMNFGRDPAGGANANAENVVSVPPSIFTPPQETSLASYLISFAIVLFLVLLLWIFIRSWIKLIGPRRKPLNEIALIARRSIQDLSSGRDSTDVIMNCYIRMSDAVADKRNLQRQASMTPAEFAKRLEHAGLPGDAVRRLTRLFESTRYGAQKAGPKDVNEAVSCLTTILHYCGEPV